MFPQAATSTDDDCLTATRPFKLQQSSHLQNLVNSSPVFLRTAMSTYLHTNVLFSFFLSPCLFFWRGGFSSPLSARFFSCSLCFRPCLLVYHLDLPLVLFPYSPSVPVLRLTFSPSPSLLFFIMHGWPRWKRLRHSLL